MDLRENIGRNLARAERDFLDELQRRASPWVEDVIDFFAGRGQQSSGFLDWYRALEPKRAEDTSVLQRLAQYVIFLQAQQKLLKEAKDLEAVFRTLYWLPGPTAVVEGLDDTLLGGKMRRGRPLNSGNKQCRGIWKAVEGIWLKGVEEGKEMKGPDIRSELEKFVSPDHSMKVTDGALDYDVWWDEGRCHEIEGPPLGKYRKLSYRTIQTYLKEIKEKTSSAPFS